MRAEGLSLISCFSDIARGIEAVSLDYSHFSHWKSSTLRVSLLNSTPIK
jgi:hypothetical protein